MWKNILAVLAGIVAGTVAIMIVEGFSHFLFPYPPGLDFADKEAMTAYMGSVPIAAKWMVILAWATGSFVAAIVTTLIAKTRQQHLALLVGAILMVFGILNMTSFPHPLWFWIVGIAVFIPFAWLGNFLLMRK
ncbi:MAG: hypothetical protein K9H64_15115 [Bacteroidales bacterium]|nr:hypothetical protein [Bacteroidales bacterium]MCF8457298.1 hypothetical protein [Bacteroidales bacterium]